MSIGIESLGITPLASESEVSTILVNALILSSGNIVQITQAQVGTGKKPLVIMSDGSIKERATTEGTPLILSAGQLRMILATETLLI